jgi:c-di-GMP-binding flagellar brake protein YcgR
MADSDKPQENDDRRRFVRLPYTLPVSYKCIKQDHVSPPESRLLEDLGAGGLSMRVDAAQPKGQILMVSLFLPPPGPKLGDQELAALPPEKCKHVEILSRVVWCAPAEQGAFLIGVQFLDLNLNDRIRLKDFLVSYHLDNPDSSLYT